MCNVRGVEPSMNPRIVFANVSRLLRPLWHIVIKKNWSFEGIPLGGSTYLCWLLRVERSPGSSRIEGGATDVDDEERNRRINTQE